MEAGKKVMKRTLLSLLRISILFIACGAIYVSIELLFRGYSHWSMFILAGILGVFCIDTPNNIYGFDLDYRIQVAISTILCTLGEGLTGLYVNIYKGWNVWNYSSLPFTFFWGQCNLFFVLAWAAIIGLFGIWFCDAFNFYIAHIDPVPYYVINKKVFLQFPDRVCKHKGGSNGKL